MQPPNQRCVSLPSLQTLARGVLAACLSFGAAIAFASPALADIKDVEPYVVAITKDGSPMKCLGGTPYYAVHVLKPGEVLRVDGEDAGWLRVEYLPGMLAFVKVQEATLEADGKTLRLDRPSRLAAVNTAGNDRGHWWYLLDQELPVGTTLQVTQALTGVNGVVYGYLVVAPLQARAYVKADAIRMATPDERAAYKGRTDLAAFAAAKAAEPAAKTEGTTARNPSGPTERMKEITSMLAAKPSPPEPAAPAPAPCDLETLKSRFETAMAQKGDQAEAAIAAAIVDFNRKIDSLGSSADDQRLRALLEQRLRVLELRREVLTSLKGIQREVATTGGAAR